MVKHLTESIEEYQIERQLNLRSKKIIAAFQSEYLKNGNELFEGNLVWDDLAQNVQYEGEGDDED